MTDDPFDTPAPRVGSRIEVPRHRGNGNPLILLPEYAPDPELAAILAKHTDDRTSAERKAVKGKYAYYSRASSFGKQIESTKALEEWGKRMVAVGLARRPDLVLNVAAHSDDLDANKRILSRICEDAIEAAKASAAANTGTALHKLAEIIDAGGELPPVNESAQRDLDAYRTCMDLYGVTHLRAEQFVVCDALQVAGSFDRFMQTRIVPGVTYVGDIKGLALTTPIPTPSGWTTMGAIEVGDEVFAADGSVCRVTLKSSVKRIGTYVVTFDDGSKIVCDREHIWWTTSGQNRAAEPTAKGVAEIVNTLDQHHRVPVAGALDLPDADLPIEPYLLGCWLGDGHKNRNVITKGRDLFAILESDGHNLGIEQVDERKPGVVTRTVRGLRAALFDNDLIGNKHVPPAYLRASTEQRLRLLQGLMDTDGTWNTARRRAAFTTTTKALALAVEELLCTLGQRPHLAEFTASGFGVTTTAYAVEFTPVGINPFRLPRKASQAAASTKPTTRSRRRLVVSVEPGPDVDTACIGVDSANHTYLCGERMIPTHNTGNTSKDRNGVVERDELGRPILAYVNSVAVQLAVYANSELYDPATGERTPLDVHKGAAIVIHLPQGLGSCELHWLNIGAGWEAAHAAKWAKEWAARTDLTVPFTPTETS